MYRIPNLCRNTVVFMALILSVVLALVFSLLRPGGFDVQVFSLGVLYIVWLVLCCMGALCLLRRFINTAKPKLRIFASFCVFALVFLGVELSAYLLFPFWYESNNGFVNRGMATMLMGILVIGFFSLLHKLELGAKAEALSRMQALQSRIRPHFLFNSLNTIAELIRQEPLKAEESIQSLSLLFRATLDDVNDQHTLDQELNLCRGYIEIERWRLGERLNYSERIEVEFRDRWYVPKLILQPLLENAIIHGTQHSASGGTVELDIRATRKHLSIKVTNSKLSELMVSGGAGIAIENIRDRLFVLYDDDHYFKARDEGEVYSVVIRIPKTPRKVNI